VLKTLCFHCWLAAKQFHEIRNGSMRPAYKQEHNNLPISDGDPKNQRQGFCRLPGFLKRKGKKTKKKNSKKGKIDIV
jgi:hypothetical protein